MTESESAGYVELNTRPLGGHARLLALVGRDRRVLDVGCSSGYLARPLVERGCVVVGVELDPDAAAAAQTFCEDVLVGDVESMELPLEPASFDVVLCGDLIEHLRDPAGFLARVRPLLRADGRLVLSTPNVANWAMRLRLSGASGGTRTGESSTGRTCTCSRARLWPRRSRVPASERSRWSSRSPFP